MGTCLVSTGLLALQLLLDDAFNYNLLHAWVLFSQFRVPSYGIFQLVLVPLISFRSLSHWENASYALKWTWIKIYSVFIVELIDSNWNYYRNNTLNIYHTISYHIKSNLKLTLLLSKLIVFNVMIFMTHQFKLPLSSLVFPLFLLPFVLFCLHSLSFLD